VLSLSGYTHTLVTLWEDQLIPLREEPTRCAGQSASDEMRLRPAVCEKASGANRSGGLIMRSLHIRVHVDKEGQAIFKMPLEFADQDIDLVVVFESLKSAETIVGWPPGFFERTAGAWQGEPLTREPQGEYEERDPLA
jgi:hypothetical protein